MQVKILEAVFHLVKRNHRVVQEMEQGRVGFLFPNYSGEHFRKKNNNAAFAYVVGYGVEVVLALELRNAVNAAAARIVHYQVQQRVGLKERNARGGALVAQPVYDVRLQTQLLGVNAGDNGSFPELDEVEHNAPRFYQHGGQLLNDLIIE